LQVAPPAGSVLIKERQQAEEQIRQMNAELEQRVSERTSQLEVANKTKDEMLVREQAARAEAEAANRAKDQFLATVSHELRTPLNAILGWSRMLRTGKIDEETADRALETIERNAKSQAQLIEDILDVSRIITGKLHLDVQPVELSAIIEEAVDAVRPAANAKEIRLQVLLNSKAGPVSGDPTRLRQVAWNLLSNAVHAWPGFEVTGV
jgi:signal transduction histidine kinase